MSDQPKRIEAKYRDTLERAEKLSERLEAGARNERIPDFNGDSNDSPKSSAHEVAGRTIMELRGGGLGNTVNVIFNRDFFVGIEREDPEGMRKILAQLHNQSAVILGELERQIDRLNVGLDKKEKALTNSPE